MLGHKWLTLPAGLMWALTRNGKLTDKVQRDREAFNSIALGLATHLATQEVYGQKVLTYFDNPNEAWLAIRDLIADEKVKAEGKLVERRGLREAVETTYTNGPIPSGEADNLVMFDNWSGFTETVLGPDEMYRFHNSQGRYWKRVRLLAEDVLAALPSPSSEQSSDPPGAKQGETPVSPPTRGRKKGSGSYDTKDEPLLKNMHELIRSDAVVSPEAAARKVAPKAFGGGTEASKRDRLAKKFRAKYGSDITRIKSD